MLKLYIESIIVFLIIFVFSMELFKERLTCRVIQIMGLDVYKYMGNSMIKSILSLIGIAAIPIYRLMIVIGLFLLIGAPDSFIESCAESYREKHNQ